MQIIFCFGISQMCLISIAATAVPRASLLFDYETALGMYMHALDDVVHSGLRSANALKILTIFYLVIFAADFVSCLCELFSSSIFFTVVSKLFLFTSLKCLFQREAFYLAFQIAGT